MCKKKKSTKRNRANADPSGGFSEPSQSNDPVNDRVNYIEPIPADSVVEVGPNKTKAAAMKPNDAMVLPTSGKTALKRVFLGLGWAADGGERIDVDVSR